MLKQRIPFDNWPHFKNLKFFDPYFYLAGPIDILLGADMFSLILTNNRYTGKIFKPSALKMPYSNGN